ncbi:BTD.2 family protein [Megaselia abdita]
MGTLTAVFGLIFLLQVSFSIQKSTTEDPYYVAAVVEFAPFKERNCDLCLLTLAQEFERFIKHPNASQVDIMVFPEYILQELAFTFVPSAEEKVIPCEQLDYDYLLTELSCYARTYQKYLVVNVNEKAVCKEGPKCKNGLTEFITNVVFDRKGMVISRYRKTHYFFSEYEKGVLPKPEISTFTTDFGVTFGHLICYDLLFYSPGQALVDQGITDIIYPNYWFQEFPFLSSLQLHQGFAHANDINFLTAGASAPHTQTTGSGIFAGKWGALDQVISEDPDRKMLVAKVPKKNANFKPNPISTSPRYDPLELQARKERIAWKRDANVDHFTTEILETTKSRINKKLCHNDFCCKFDIEMERIDRSGSYLQGYTYRLAAYEGPGTLHRVEKGEFGICAVIACTNNKLFSCGTVFPKDVPHVANDFYFKKINIKGAYTKKDKMIVMPSTVNFAFEPLPADSYKYSKDVSGNVVNFDMTLTKVRSDLLTFGLYGNYYVEKKVKHNVRDEL